jgi:alpha-tubulin suppressor-like RCC1 family protein
MASFWKVFIFTVFLTAIASAGSRMGEGGIRRHTRLATGAGHVCTVLDDGTVRCWGNNTDGQMGNGNNQSSSLPVQVSGVFHVTSLVAGTHHTCALQAEGIVWCWGLNIYGQLGNGVTGGTSTIPVVVNGLGNVVSIAAGLAHTCAVRLDGTVWCWGLNSLGQLGTGVASITSNPTPIQANVVGAISAVSGDFHTCALLAGGTVKCWGRGNNGQLGAGFNNTGPQPVVVSSLPNVIDLAAGGDVTCALLINGIVDCWGSNFYQQLAVSSVANAYTPVTSTNSATVALTVGAKHVCAITFYGGATCWGDNSKGELGDLTTNSRFSPAPVTAVTDAVEISAGDSFTCAAIVTGMIRCWGNNADGEHGNGNTNSTLGVDSIAGLSGTISARGVSAGDAFSCALRGTGAVACWGAGQHGQLGNSASSDSPNPVAVTGLSKAFLMAAGQAHACALDSGGDVQCWGEDDQGQLGDNQPFSSSSMSNKPVSVELSSSATGIAAGSKHVCALTFDTVACWGSNGFGQLGFGSVTNISRPIPVPGISGAVQVSAGQDFTCALLVDGTAKCWGRNDSHQLGGGAGPGPVAVAGLTNAIAIAAGADHACALSAFGTVSCWGGNSSGQIGDGTVNPAGFPDTVSALTNATGLSAGGQFTCALRADSEVSCWGDNSVGELAAADLSSPHLTPVKVIDHFITVSGTQIPIPIQEVVSIATNGYVSSRRHTCALFVSGQIRCWGANEHGQIGDGTLVNRPRPTTANSFTANVDTAVTLGSHSRIASVTALVNCESGEAHIQLTLEQGGVTGNGSAVAQCSNQLDRVPLSVPALGPDAFQPGSAVAHVEAVVMVKGTVTEDQHWTRQVTLSPQ